MLDIRFSSALKAMLFLAVAAEDEPAVLSSTYLAAGLGTNPSLIRKLLVPLLHAGLVESVKGRGGGTKLARPAEEITLAEIYRCSIGDKPVWACRPDGEVASCEVTANAAEYFTRLMTETEQAMLEVLERRTLADSVTELRQLGREPVCSTEH